MQKRKINAICLARIEAVRAAAPGAGITVTELYNSLENAMKKKCTKLEIQLMLERDQMLGVKTVSLGNGRFLFEELKAGESNSDGSSPEQNSENGDDDSFARKMSHRPPTPGLAMKKHLKTVSQVTQRERSERKRIQKVVFDPSDPLVVKKPKLKSIETKEEEKQICLVCEEEILLSEEDSDEATVCDVCSRRIHKACNSSTSHWGSSRWRCQSCKICGLCRTKNSGRNETFFTCTVCNDSFHMKCANIKKSKVGKDWCCAACSDVFGSDAKSTTESRSSSPTEKPQSSQELKDRKGKPISRRQSRDVIKKEIKKETNVKGQTSDGEETIPDCTNWTPQQVHSYFLVYVPSQDAQVFLDQEVDGKILLLLNRFDVLTRFNLKLGPALKVYSLVKRLQERCSDIRICWI